MKYLSKTFIASHVPDGEIHETHIRENRLRVDAYDAPFWDKVADNAWEPYTFDILSRLLTPKTTYCDLGAWIGPTVLFAATRCDTVVCMEPDPVARQRLLNNLHWNGVENVTLYDMALSDRSGRQRMASFRKRLGDSMTSLLAGDSPLPGAEVETVTWDDFARHCDVDQFDVIKMDIEGSEFSLMPTMETFLARRKPAIFLSLHPHRLPRESRKENVQTLFSCMGMYAHCLTPDLQPVDTKKLCFDGKNAYRGSFLFIDSLALK